MAIFNRKYLTEVYGNSDKKNATKSPTENDDKHLTEAEIRRIMTIVTANLEDFPKLKKCCDYINLNDSNTRDYINNNGERKSAIERYNDDNYKAFLKLIDGDVYSGYPDFKDKGSEEFSKDSAKFVSAMNKSLKSKGIKAIFSTELDKEDESIGFGVRSRK